MNPLDGSERQVKFQKHRQFIVDLVRDEIQHRKDEKEGAEEHVPFIDNLLQCAVPEEQVCACVYVRDNFPACLSAHTCCVYALAMQFPSS